MAGLSGLSSGWLSQVLAHHIPADGILGMLLMLGPALLKLCAQGCIDCQSVFLLTELQALPEGLGSSTAPDI